MPPLSQAQLDAFARDGYLHVSAMIPPAELAAPDRDAMLLIQRGLGGRFEDKRWIYSRDAEDIEGPCLYRINGLVDADMPASFKALLAYPALLQAVSQLVRGDYFVASVHALVFKLPHRGRPIVWHQDPVKMYRFPVFNIDIYLDQAHPENGGLWVIPGSHLTGYHDGQETPGFIESWTQGKAEDAPGAITVITQPGDVVFHATTLVHGSFWNRTDTLRRTIYYHMDHWRDVRLAGDRWPQRLFREAQQSTAAAIRK